MSKKLQILSVCALALVMAFAMVAAAQGTKVDGKWDMTTEGGQRGPQMNTLTLTSSGKTLTGTLSGGRGDTPVTGTIDGANITFSVTRNTPNGDVTTTYTGTVSGDSMKGTAKMAQGDRNWTATRSKP